LNVLRRRSLIVISCIYAQFVPESQRRALAKMSAMVEARTSKPIAQASTRSIAMPPQSRMVN